MPLTSSSQNITNPVENEVILSLEQNLATASTAQALYELGLAFQGGKLTGFAKESVEAQDGAFRCFYQALISQDATLIIQQRALANMTLFYSEKHQNSQARQLANTLMNMVLRTSYKDGRPHCYFDSEKINTILNGAVTLDDRPFKALLKQAIDMIENDHQAPLPDFIWKNTLSVVFTNLLTDYFKKKHPLFAPSFLGVSVKDSREPHGKKIILYFKNAENWNHSNVFSNPIYLLTQEFLQSLKPESVTWVYDKNFEVNHTTLFPQAQDSNKILQLRLSTDSHFNNLAWLIFQKLKISENIFTQQMSYLNTEIIEAEQENSLNRGKEVENVLNTVTNMSSSVQKMIINYLPGSYLNRDVVKLKQEYQLLKEFLDLGKNLRVAASSQDRADNAFYLLIERAKCFGVLDSADSDTFKTAAHVAAEQNSSRLYALKKAGARMDCIDFHGQTPWGLAIKNDCPHQYLTLFQLSFTTQAKEQIAFSLRQAANSQEPADNDFIALVNQAKQFGVLDNAGPGSLKTAAHRAAEQGNVSRLAILKEAGASLCLQDSKDLTPYQLASRKHPFNAGLLAVFSKQDKKNAGNPDKPDQCRIY